MTTSSQMARTKVADHNGDICSSPQEAMPIGKGQKWKGMAMAWRGGGEVGGQNSGWISFPLS